MNIDNAKCQFVINPLTSTFYGNTGGDASRPYIRIFQDSESTDDFVANRVGIVQDCDQWKREELSNYYKLKGVLETKYCKSIGSAGYGLQNTTLRIITFQSKGLTYRISSPRADVIAPKFSQYIQENDLKDIFEFLNEV